MSDPTALWVVQQDGSGAKHQSELVHGHIEEWNIIPVVGVPLGVDRADPYIESRQGLVPVDSLTDVVESIQPDVVFYHHFNEHIAKTHPEVKRICPTLFRVGINFWEVTMGGPALSDALADMVEFTTHQDRLVAPSMHVKQRLCDMGLPDGHVDVIPTVYEFPEDKPAVGGPSNETVGHLAARINPLKNQLTTVLATRAMYERFEDISPRTIVTGTETKYAQSLERVAKAAKIDHRVEFAGYIDNLDADYWPKVDVTVLPSFSENAPMTVVESAGHGVPVVAAAGGWSGQYESVLTAPPDDPGAWSVVVGRLLSDEALYEQTVESQYEELASAYDADGIAERYQQSLRAVVAEE